MRKHLGSAIVVEVLVLGAAIAFLLAFLFLGVGRENPTANITIVLAGVIVVAFLLVVLWQRTLVREAMVRHFYLSDGWIHNHEIGYAPISRIVPDRDAYEFVTFAAEALAHMSYGFDVADAPESFEPTYVIESNIFLFHTIGDEDDLDAGVVVDEWEGRLRVVDDSSADGTGFRDIAEFSSAKELANLLEENGVLAPKDDSEEMAAQ